MMQLLQNRNVLLFFSLFFGMCTIIARNGEVDTVSGKHYVHLYTEKGNVTEIIAHDSLLLIGRAYGDSIALRWYPESFDSWLRHLEFGYTLKKYELNPENEVMFSEADLVSEINITPWSEEKIEREFNLTKDSLLLLTGTALGENVSIKDREEAYNLVGLLGMRFPKLYKMLALQFTDVLVEGEKIYYYKIELTGSESKLIENDIPILNSYIPVPTPPEIDIVQRDFSIDLLIDKSFIDTMFAMIDISIAETKKGTYTSLSAGPFKLNMDKSVGKYYNYNIPVKENYVTYYFKFEGMNLFGEMSSPVYFEGFGIDLDAPPPPTINFPYLIGDHEVNISWEKIEAPDDFVGYKIELGKSPTDNFITISELLDPETDDYIYQLDSTSNETAYFKVAAYDKQGNKGTSIPMMLNIRDSIPPLAPSNLTGNIDDDGFVEIYWDEAIEDLNGYRVFFANDTTSEFSQLTNEVLSSENLFRDTIAMNMLADEIYYIVEAEDRSYNRSDYSKILTLKRPDILPPVAPVILPPESSAGGVLVNWRASTSYDVVMHYLFRKEDAQSEEEWVALDSLPFYGENYIDSTAQIEVHYNYRVQAMDDVGLQSDFTMAVSGRRYFDGDIDVVSNLEAQFDEDSNAIELTWLPKISEDRFLSDKDYRYVIYKGSSPDDLTRLIQLIDKTPLYVDNEIELDQDYFYAIQLLYEDGKQSKISEPVFITLK